MSRFSPTVAPEYYSTTGRELADALTAIEAQRRAQQHADDVHASAQGTYVANGGRFGTAPTRQQPVEAPSDEGIPTSLAGAFDAAGGLNGQAPAHHPMWDEVPRAPRSAGWDEQSPAGGAPAQGGGSLADAMRAGLEGGAAPAPALTHGGGAPGSFQPGLGGFAPASPAAADPGFHRRPDARGAADPGFRERPSRALSMTMNDDRYIQTDPEHYVDTRQTKQGQQLAAQMAMLDARNAGAYDRAMMGNDTRRYVADEGNSTRTDIAAGNRESRESIADANRTSRESIAAQADTTRRLGYSLRAANGGREITATAKEANAQKAATSLLANYGGDYGKALDALEHTPEGQDLAASGVTRRHLYVALGQQVNVDTRQAMHGKTIPSDAGRAAGKVGAVRSAVLEGTMSDADLWEKKKGEGLTPAQATEYVRNRKK